MTDIHNPDLPKYLMHDFIPAHPGAEAWDKQKLIDAVKADLKDNNKIPNSVSLNGNTFDRDITHLIENFKDGKFKASQNGVEQDWLKSNVFITPSYRDKRYFAFVVKDGNTYHYFESVSNGAISPACIEFISRLNQKSKNILLEKRDKSLDFAHYSTFDPTVITRDTEDTCFLHYLNGTLEVTETGVQFHDKHLPCWAGEIIQREFDFETLKNLNDPEFLRTSDYQNHEFFERLNDICFDPEKLEIAIGFLCHSFQSPGLQKMVFMIDGKPKSKADGGTGKTLAASIVSQLKPQQNVRWLKGNDNRFSLAAVTPEHRCILFDDVYREFLLDDQIKSIITGNMPLEGKGVNAMTIPLKDKPKMVATSQGWPRGYMDESTRRRCYLVRFTDSLQTDGWSSDDIFKNMTGFDFGMVDCVQKYLANRKGMRATPPVTDDEADDYIKFIYGAEMLELVGDVRRVVAREGWISNEDIQLDLAKQNERTKFLTAYRERFNESLIRSKKNGIRGWKCGRD
jgi:hypothetical protein